MGYVRIAGYTVLAELTTLPLQFDLLSGTVRPPERLTVPAARPET